VAEKISKARSIKMPVYPFAISTKFFSSCRPTFWLFSG
jgi:hypothetical protein